MDKFNIFWMDDKSLEEITIPLKNALKRAYNQGVSDSQDVVLGAPIDNDSEEQLQRWIEKEICELYAK